jgi:hypothetical protein
MGLENVDKTLSYSQQENEMDHHEIKAELEALETRMLERLERIETTLLKEFRKWAVPIDRMTKTERKRV